MVVYACHTNRPPATWRWQRIFNVIDILKSIKHPREKEKAQSVGVLRGTDALMVNYGPKRSLTVELWQAKMIDRSVNP